MKKSKEERCADLAWDEAMRRIPAGSHREGCPLDHTKLCTKLVMGKVCNRPPKDREHGNTHLTHRYENKYTKES